MINQELKWIIVTKPVETKITQASAALSQDLLTKKTKDVH
jgi:hypothetical protein